MTTPLPSSPPALLDEPDETSSRPVLRVVHANQGGDGPGLAKTGMNPRTAAQCLREARLALGWTIGRAATNYGVTAETWANWEHGRSRVDGDALLWIVWAAAERTGT